VLTGLSLTVLQITVITRPTNILTSQESLRVVEKKREQLQDFLTTLLDIVPDQASRGCYDDPSELCGSQLIQYRELGDQLAYDLDMVAEMTADAGYMDVTLTADK